MMRIILLLTILLAQLALGGTYMIVFYVNPTCNTDTYLTAEFDLYGESTILKYQGDPFGISIVSDQLETFFWISEPCTYTGSHYGQGTNNSGIVTVDYFCGGTESGQFVMYDLVLGECVTGSGSGIFNYNGQVIKSYIYTYLSDIK